MKKVTKIINKKEARFLINKDIFFKPLQFSRLTLVIFGFVFAVFILFIALNFIFLITLNKDIKKDFNVLEAVTNEKINVINNSLSQVVPTQVMLSQTAQNQGAPTNQNQVREVFNSFGDHFSGLAYVNNRKTDMSFDENTTAFTFPPLYSF